LAKRAPSISHVASVITDVTQRKREEMMRRQTEKLLAAPLIFGSAFALTIAG